MPSVESAHLEQMRMSAALFRLIGHRLVIDGEQLNRLATMLSADLHAAGFRLPVRTICLDSMTATINEELYPAVRKLPEFDRVPSTVLRKRTAAISGVLAARGYRKVAG